MSFRSLTKCSRLTPLKTLSETTVSLHQDTVSSATGFACLGHHRDAHSSSKNNTSPKNTTRNSSTGLRLEGIQGPLHTSLSVTESKRLLDNAAKQVTAGFSQQGVQGNHLHTDHKLQSKVSASTANIRWDIHDAACPQGVQGSVDSDSQTSCAYLSTWMENCQRYGLDNCDQQLQGIQSGRLTLAQVLAEQEALIAEIANSYRQRAQEQPDIEDESLQGSQEEMQLPDIGAPCPQGVQGDDCVQFKLWLENCHRFGLHECTQQLQGFQSGRVTLAQIFAEQDALIREVVQQYQKRRN